MNYNYNKLKGKIKEQFNTQEEFAKALGIGASTLNLKLNNKTEWSQDEMRKALKLLNVNEGQIEQYFFTHNI